MEKGLVYRYHFDRIGELKGQPYPSPTQVVETRYGKMVEELIQPTLHPVLISSEEFQKLLSLVKAWRTWLKAQFEFYLLAKKGELSSELVELVSKACTPLEWKNGDLPSGYSSLLPFIRLDALRTEKGFQAVDINSTRPAGVGDAIVLSNAYRSIFKADGNPLPMEETFVETVKTCFSEWQENLGKERKGDLGILIREDDGDFRNFEILKDILAKQLPAELVYPEDLVNNSRRFLGFVRSRIKEGDPFFEKVAEGYPQDRFLISPLYRRFLGNKIWMYLVKASEAKPFFQERLKEDYETIAECFPETGIIEGKVICLAQDTLALEALPQKEWILKQPASSSGREMRWGFLTGKKKWSQVIQEDDLTGWIAQRFLPVQEELPVLNEKGEVVTEKLFTKYGIFILGGKLAGVEVMARRHPLVHGARNTYFSTVWLKT